jgi:hypothetical protein
VLFLEGGYELGALRCSMAATLGALVDGAGPVEAPSSGGPGMEQLDLIASHREQALDGSG